MSWMSPFTVPITILPMRARTGFRQQRLQDGHAGFHRVGGPAELRGTNRMPSRKSMPTMVIPPDQCISQNVVRLPATFQQNVDAFFDLFSETVIEVVMHLLHQLFIIEFAQDDISLLDQTCASFPGWRSISYPLMRHLGALGLGNLRHGVPFHRPEGK